MTFRAVILSAVEGAVEKSVIKKSGVRRAEVQGHAELVSASHQKMDSESGAE
ncbi:MAG: hypothetical protein VX772_10470 [Bacteroidota bacterium]|uniref:Uncharacterized protein n=1 Tax=Flagellimonas okinawensis TaxID=3031324 RepID=A0ABT5XJV1_9FLAO|nr:hypothetical protein [[Muricauda] okinawensis]MDF0706163.1 hypothetical protein [[Muricauda] okinawensis]MEC8832773.1 hypothetical protein [Bacteroidota bacterium]